ncbi:MULTISPECIES: MFS transporter [Streptomyces]|uniref:Enterobactin exporter EntS n=1 Tax=Streptomyces rubrolavendulae TaxID=285473 RepID=A0A1D8G768_9ACTN|nr:MULTISPECIES: MFS transporter [Streptomyces]AOT61315.1 enterobactin exporter EntS [Streptomyces rubrolavendulae]UQS30445.1 MFS transporter [Streptomyces fradiae]
MTATPVASDTRPPTPLGRPFVWLWHACAGSNLADGIYQVALPVTAVHLGGGAGGVALVAAMSRAPWLVFALFSGLLVDRCDERRLMRIVNSGRVVVLGTTALLLALGRADIAVLATAAFLLGIGETIFDTAFHTTTPGLVAPDQLERANSRLQAAEITTNQMAGPPLGGILLGLSAGLAFGATALLYLATVLALLALPASGKTAPDAPGAPGSPGAPGAGGDTSPAGRPGIIADIRTGLRFLVGNRTLLVYALGVGALNLAWAAVYAALPVLALPPGPLGLSSASYGSLLMVAGVSGLVVGLLSATAIGRLGARPSMALGLAGMAAGFLLPGLRPTVAVLGVGLGLTGLLILINVVTVSYRQRTVPQHLLGRVTSAYRLIAFGCLPVGSALAGVIGSHFGPRPVLVLAGCVVCAAAIPMTVYTRPATDASAHTA